MPLFRPGVVISPIDLRMWRCSFTLCLFGGVADHDPHRPAPAGPAGCDGYLLDSQVPGDAAIAASRASAAAASGFVARSFPAWMYSPPPRVRWALLAAEANPRSATQTIRCTFHPARSSVTRRTIAVSDSWPRSS